MRKLLLYNVDVALEYAENSFSVGEYTFYSSGKVNNGKYHCQNAYLTHNGKQFDSIIYKGGIYGNENSPRKRKLIEDILVIGSLLTGTNWALYSRRRYNNFFLVPSPYLANIRINGKKNIENYFETSLKSLYNPNWQIQFENGFHLRMIINSANNYTQESRFLANVIIWEWLYPHINNPKGATSKDESINLKTIFEFILCHYWPSHRENIEQHKAFIFHVLRNQLAHSGKIPINRHYAESWMKELKWDNPDDYGIKDYLSFFDVLTQIIVLKTLDINADVIAPKLHSFLDTGQLAF
ncbi:hypothetical protein [Legionella feeleii]|uniref:Uncharacterized protein n=1 Tax=Legionella feeleii TaxID=453 RepID=A0A0W0TIA9_9GAMM|nr:hypothetical protein [Legionella feeleii]KTC94917.1 hypothetical protein Lfee_2581 [Legionella feeleii]SPX59817.1 Uncharacterised protein [Legionella feeleii]